MAGGFNLARLARTVSLNLSYPGCPSEITNFPLTVSAAVAATIDGTPVFCGGAYPYSNACYKYNITDDRWDQIASMSEERAWAVVVQLNHEDFWVLGNYVFIQSKMKIIIY